MKTTTATALLVAGFGLASLPQPEAIPRSADTPWGTIYVGDAVRVELVNGMQITNQRVRIGEVPDDFTQREPTAEEIGIGVWIVHEVDEIATNNVLLLSSYYVPVGEEAQLGYKADAPVWRVPLDHIHDLVRLVPADPDAAVWYNMDLAHNGTMP